MTAELEVFPLNQESPWINFQADNISWILRTSIFSAKYNPQNKISYPRNSIRAKFLKNCHPRNLIGVKYQKNFLKNENGWQN